MNNHDIKIGNYNIRIQIKNRSRIQINNMNYTATQNENFRAQGPDHDY